jgi:hypothetical protein
VLYDVEKEKERVGGRVGERMSERERERGNYEEEKSLMSTADTVLTDFSINLNEKQKLGNKKGSGSGLGLGLGSNTNKPNQPNQVNQGHLLVGGLSVMVHNNRFVPLLFGLGLEWE